MSVDTSDGETCDVYERNIRRARKEHKCSSCREMIRRGDLYSYTFLVCDGHDAIKRCARCEVMFRHLEERMRGNCDEQPDLELKCGHTYEERWREAPPPEIAALAFMTAAEAQARLTAGKP